MTAKTYCDDCNITHTAMTCFAKPKKAIKTSRKPIKKESTKARKLRLEANKMFYRLNPSNADGNWFCYLGIAPNCTFVLNNRTLVIEHVIPRVKSRKDKYNPHNLKPACTHCNELKGSWTLQQLIELGHHELRDLL